MRSKQVWSSASAARTRFRVLPLAAAIAFCCAGYANAATIAVNDASDDSLPGKCTLADAVAAINTASAVNGCAAGDGNSDTIDLSFFTSATTIAFENPAAADRLSAIAFTKPATITGPLGADGKPLVTVRRSATSGLNFRVIATSADLTIQNTIVTGGYANERGVGVYASGQANLTISNSVVSENKVSGPGIYSGGGVASVMGNITVTNSTISGNSSNYNGGGLYTLYSGTITLTGSTVSGNHADYSGGGVSSFNGDVVVNSSTVSGNAVYQNYYFNGHLYKQGGFGGGGINVYKSLTMTNSTVANNYARLSGAGIYVGAIYNPPRPARPARRTHKPAYMYPGGFATLNFCTISGNRTSSAFQMTSGMVASNYLKAVGTIIKDNAYSDLQGPKFTFAGSNNIIGGAQASWPAVDCDPKLGPLAANGGGTLTMGLLDGSCAIDAGPAMLPAGIDSDQRGLPRPVNAISDIGAVEKQGPNDGLPDLVFQNGFDT